MLDENEITIIPILANTATSEGSSEQNQEQNSIQKTFLREFAECISSSALGAGVGYLFGGLLKTLVDLSKIGMVEMQKHSTEENAKKYIGINEYTTTGISFGLILGAGGYLFLSELVLGMMKILLRFFN